MKEQEELLRAVWFTEAEVKEGRSERLGSGKRESFENENGWLPISGPGLVWLEDNLKGGVDTGPDEENDAEILSFPPKILDGWKPPQRKEGGDGERKSGRERAGEEAERKMVTSKPPMFFNNISPQVPDGTSSWLQFGNLEGREN